MTPIISLSSSSMSLTPPSSLWPTFYSPSRPLLMFFPLLKCSFPRTLHNSLHFTQSLLNCHFLREADWHLRQQLPSLSPSSFIPLTLPLHSLFLHFKILCLRMPILPAHYLWIILILSYSLSYPQCLKDNLTPRDKLLFINEFISLFGLSQLELNFCYQKTIDLTQKNKYIYFLLFMLLNYMKKSPYPIIILVTHRDHARVSLPNR